MEQIFTVCVVGEFCEELSRVFSFWCGFDSFNNHSLHDLHMFLCIKVFVICFVHLWIHILALRLCVHVSIPILCAYKFLLYTHAQCAWLGTFLIYELAHFHSMLCAFM